MSVLEGKSVLVGVTGGIAAYKAAEIVRALVREGATVRVVMTRGAQQFLTPLTFQTLSNHPVATEVFDLTQESEIGHIRLADRADVVLVAPATANVVAKVAHGIADDLLTTVLLATRAPVVMAPAMNVNMLRNPLVQENLEKLQTLGMQVVPPAEGFLACGYEGAGRLADEATVLEALRRALTPPDLASERVLVTAGPTREPIDPVRFLSNRSSGKMGYAIALAARRHGAEVVLVSGPTALALPPGVGRMDVTTAAEMRQEVLRREAWATVVVMAAAVADYRVERPAVQKLKKREGRKVLELEETTDILAELGRRRTGDRILVGFAAETENGARNALGKLREKNLDLMVLNDVSHPDAGFDVDTNRVAVIRPDGSIDEWPVLPKDEVADRLMTTVAAIRSAKTPAAVRKVADRRTGAAKR